MIQHLTFIEVVRLVGMTLEKNPSRARKERLKNQKQKKKFLKGKKLARISFKRDIQMFNLCM